MKIAFFGTPEFAVPSLDAIAASHHELLAVAAQPDRPAGRGMKLKSPPVAQRARELGLEVVQPAGIRKEEFLHWFRSLGCDLAVVVAYGRILPAALLEAPRLGMINVHGSLLPKYRGAAPIQRAIEHGETRTGVTIMRLDEQLDHGPVLGSRELAIAPEERTPALAARMSSAGAELLIEVLDRMEQGSVEEVEQDHERATFAPKIEKSESRIDWSDPAEGIYNRFRAFWPWPGIQIQVGGEPLKLIELASPRPDEPSVPAGIAAIESGRIRVGTGEGTIDIARVQRPGRGPVDAEVFARDRGLGVGDRLA